MRKIIHLSDLHTGYVNNPLNINLERSFNLLVDSLVYYKQPPEKYVVVITGDLVNNACETGYEKAMTGISKLKEKFEVLVIPGNHDYGNGKKDKKRFVKEFKQTFYNNPGETYPKIDIVDDIAFIGLDSMEQVIIDGCKDDDTARGKLGPTQLKELKRMLKNDPRILGAEKKVVCLHHHPFHLWPTNRLIDSEELREVIENKVDAILYGHNHMGLCSNGGCGIPLCYDAGSSTGMPPIGRTPVRIINLEKKDAPHYEIDFIRGIQPS